MTATAYLAKTNPQETRVIPTDGDAAWSLVLDLPTARNGVAPSISIEMSHRRGNDTCGFGVGLNVAGRIFRRDRLDTAWTTRPLVLEGVGELVEVSTGEWRPVESALRCKVVGNADGTLCVMHPDGRRDFFGETAAGRETVKEGGLDVIVQWLQERSECPDADVMHFEYLSDADVPLISRVRFGPYAVAFDYEPRPDPVLRVRAGRMRSLELRLATARLLHKPAGGAATGLRRWELSYGEHIAGWSVLQRVHMEGVDANGKVDAWPNLTIEVVDAGASDATVHALRLPQGPLPPSQGRVGSLSWFGNGRPALFEADATAVRVFSDDLPGGTVQMNTVPREFFDYPGRTAFSDVSGDGLSDLILLGDDVAGQFRAVAHEGFADFDLWDFALPPGLLFGRNAALCDIDGDGGNEVVCFDEVAQEWLAVQPARAGAAARRFVLDGALPGEGLDGIRLHLADTTGDGLADFVQVAADRLRVSFNLGSRTFEAPREVALERPELLSDSPKLGFVDFTGDGASDLYALEGSGIHVWINRSCQRFAYLGWFELNGLQNLGDMIVCDWHGIGRSGVLWWSSDGTMQFLSPLGQGALGALSRIDNGMGFQQEFRWTTTARQSGAARRAGRPWRRELPFPLLVCSEVRTIDASNETARALQYFYEDPCFWLAKRRFLGFERTEIRQLNAAGQPTRSTELVHSVPAGVDPSLDEVVLAGTLKTLRLRAHDGSAFPWMRIAHRTVAWQVRNAGGQSVAASAMVEESVTEHLGNDGATYAMTKVTYGDVDAHGRPCTITETAVSPAASLVIDGRTIEFPGSRHRLETRIAFAEDEAGRFLDRRRAVRQTDGDGAALAATLLFHDGRTDGAVGTTGRLTAACSMVLTDVQATALAATGDLNAMGYFRIDGEIGWWCKDREVEETQTAEGRRLTRLRDALGHVVESTYDTSGIWVERSETATGTHRFEPDPRSNNPAREVDEFGLECAFAYDGLGRLRQVKESDREQPVRTIDPEFAPGGFVLHTQAIADEALGTVTRSRELLDAQGRRRETVLHDPASGTAFSSGTRRYDLEGQLVSRTVPHAVDAADGTPLAADLRCWTFEYDALNRVTSASEPGGARRTLQYVDSWIVESDPMRPWKPRRVFYADARGQLVLAASGDGSAITRLERDARGNPTDVIDLFGRHSRFEYDLLGRQIRSETPDGGVQTLLIDALGAVRRTWRNGELTHEVSIDAAGRVERTQTEGRTASTFTYNPTGTAAGAGLLKDAVGPAGSVSIEYDRGQRVSKRTYQRSNAANRLALQYDFRADGKLRSLTLPQGANVRWNYDAYGRIASIPNFVKSTEYGADGALKAMTFQNGVRTEFQREADGSRLQGCLVMAGTSELLRSGVYRLAGDAVGEWTDGGLRKTLVADALQRMVSLKIGDDLVESREYGTQQQLTRIGELTLEYDADLRLVRAGEDTVTVNGRGAVTSWGARSFAFDGKDMVKAIASPAGSRRYDVDHEGRLCAAYGADDALVFYQPDPHIVETPQGLFAIIHFGALPVARVRLLPGGLMSEPVFLHHDTFGRLTLVTDAAAGVVKDVRFSAGGVPVVAVGVIDEGLDLLFEGNRHVPVGDCYLQGTRLYAPSLGRFLSADVVAYDAADPLSGDRYLFGRGNPLQRGDPSGLFLDDFWRDAARAWNDWGRKVVMAIAVIVIAIFASPAVLIGMAVGAVIGGLAANAKGGDVIEGMLFGALLGAAGAWGAAAVPAGSGIWGAAAAGALKGSIVGAAMGLAAGYAGGAGSAEDMLQATARGALTGAVTGALMGAGGEWLQHARTETVSLDMQGAKFVKSIAESIQAGDNAGTALLKASWEFATPFLKNAAIEAGKYMFGSGAWGTTAQVVASASAGYQAGGFGKPLERVIWEDVLGQRVEREIFSAKF